MVSIVIITHSQQLADGIAELADQMSGEESVPIFPAGGTDDGRIGTSFEKVETALEQALADGDGVLVLLDLGSAVMVTQMVIESLPEDSRQRIRLTNAPLTEGAIAAVVAAAGGEGLDAVQRAAEQALDTPKVQDAAPAVPAASALSEEKPDAGVKTVELVIPNPSGLHARPAARFVRAAMAFEADITVQNVTHERPEANAKSMMEVANTGTAWQGERIRITARGDDAKEALETLKELVESGFGEMGDSEVPPPTRASIPRHEPDTSPPMPDAEVGDKLQGIPASEGFVVGPAFLFDAPKLEIERSTVSNVDQEVRRLREALEAARRQLFDLRMDIAGDNEDVAEIFEFQRMMLEDPKLVQAIEEAIRRDAWNAEAAAEQVVEDWVARFEGAEDTVMRLRATDVRDAGHRLLSNLLGVEPEQSFGALEDPVVVVAEDLSPSDTAQMDPDKVVGLCTAAGGATSHVAILARMRNLPAVVGLGSSVLRIPDETLLAVDGEAGVVEVDPPPEVVHQYRERRRQRSARIKAAMSEREAPAVTKDGHRVEVVANVGDAASAREALEFGAEGIGLLRTEFLYLDRETMPDEEEQYEAYGAVADAMEQKPVIIRTLDVGGDKPLPYVALEPEMNPFLGVRAIRLTLERPELFQPQLRAILRAAHGRNVKVMFPLITTRQEVVQARDALEQAHSALAEERIPHEESIDVGVMVETPAAALKTEEIAELVDFFSIGSNDLTQYTLATDRGNRQLGHLFQALDPAVLRLIARVIDAARASGKWTGLCGELAGHRRAIPVLLGLGLDEFSMTPSAIPEAKQIIRSLTLAQAQEVAQEALALPSAADVAAYLDSFLDELQLPASD